MQQRNSRPDSFKKDAVRRLMARGSKTVAELAEELGVSPSVLHR
ncbi:MAG: Transposase [Pseudomonadota bacterium]|jgi:transposase-like protein